MNAYIVLKIEVKVVNKFLNRIFFFNMTLQCKTASWNVMLAELDRLLCNFLKPWKPETENNSKVAYLLW